MVDHVNAISNIADGKYTIYIIGGFPIETTISSGCPIATLDYLRV